MNHRLRPRAPLSLMLIATLTACASIMHGGRQDVGFTSTPPNARILVDGSAVGNTPLTTKLERKKPHTVRLELTGYQAFEAKLERKTSGWVWGNIVFGGVIGVVIDASTGGMYKLTPPQVTAQLASGGSTATLVSDGLYFAVTLAPDPAWECVGKLERQ
jgi:hypothetical protein